MSETKLTLSWYLEVLNLYLVLGSMFVFLWDTEIVIIPYYLLWASRTSYKVLIFIHTQQIILFSLKIEDVISILPDFIYRFKGNKEWSPGEREW